MDRISLFSDLRKARFLTVAKAPPGLVGERLRAQQDKLYDTDGWKTGAHKT